MTESPDMDGPGKTYRSKGELRPAQYRFLWLGVLLVIIIGVILSLLNESIKEETNFQEEYQKRSISQVAPVTNAPAAGLAYEEAKPENVAAPPTDTAQPPSESGVVTMPSTDASPEPTTAAPDDE